MTTLMPEDVTHPEDDDATMSGSRRDATSMSSSSQRRRSLLSSSLGLVFFAGATVQPQSDAANAAPPISIIAEELGYFPVTNAAGETVYVPKRVQRESTEQAVQLAERLRLQGVVMTGTYWCPHTARQKELFGRQAWERIEYVECAPKGFRGNPGYCIANQVEGYPTWVFPSGRKKKNKPVLLSGERPLSVLAEQVGMTDFDETLEGNLPGLPGSACK